MLLQQEVWPSCWESARLLLQTTPYTLKDHLEKCLREVRYCLSLLLFFLFPSLVMIISLSLGRYRGGGSGMRR
jgi:hypothetical protein